MTATSQQRGHRVEYINDAWVYSDDKTTASIDRNCARCKRSPTPEGHDACLGTIEGATGACCGHGVEDKVICMGEG